MSLVIFYPNKMVAVFKVENDADIKNVMSMHFGPLGCVMTPCCAWKETYGDAVWAHWDNMKGEYNKFAVDKMEPMGARIGALRVTGPVILCRHASVTHVDQSKNVYAPLSDSDVKLLIGSTSQ